MTSPLRKREPQRFNSGVHEGEVPAGSPQNRRFGMTSTQTPSIRPYSSAIGAEVLGVDLSRPLDDRTWAQIHRAFLDYSVLFFRDQDLAPEQHLAFSRRFGELEPYPFADGMAGYPELVEVVKLPDEVQTFGGGWHVDMSFRETPPLGAALYAIDVPSAGGDTLFANMHLAFESLSRGMQKLARSLRAVHDSHLYLSFKEAREPAYRGMKMRNDDPPAVRAHPLTRMHPESGRTSLFISPGYCGQLEGMNAPESAALLDMLERHATRHEFICRFRWPRPGRCPKGSPARRFSRIGRRARCACPHQSPCEQTQAPPASSTDSHGAPRGDSCAPGLRRLPERAPATLSP